jgi:hypothetical protein
MNISYLSAARLLVLQLTLFVTCQNKQPTGYVIYINISLFFFFET